ncbi:unnamed protein product [Acanthoscelides obtectus]|uniref:Uncharacterized protein n=1 Tax=Acanthoscelides obtectus TaxID=200917 RepID=A0A9P0LEZ2_ACAOB|nr:unnamed protein product [Acanthoscelides obtectus]CAK1655756.1 hypothetical protein AOBTE_LOCUS19306 [Acanthoscelides obtectus]
MKIRMLNWPFCLCLVTAPSSLAAKIRGSIAQNELVLAALEDMKHLMISWKEASSLLSEDLSDQGSSSSEQVAKRSKKVNRIKKLEKSLRNIHNESCSASRLRYIFGTSRLRR